MNRSWQRPLSRDSACVVFVHGFLSSTAGCWSKQGRPSWPDLVAVSFPGLAICTVDYNTEVFSGHYSISDVADSLYERLLQDGVLTPGRRIAFVCHSMGGLIVRRMLIERREGFADLQLDLGLLLVASPSLGSDYAKWLSPIARFLGHTQADALRFSEANLWLVDLHRDFDRLLERNRLKIVGRELIEDRLVVLRWLWFFPRVVSAVSGAQYFPEPLKIAGSDHFSIAAPESADSLQHGALCRLIHEVMGVPAVAADSPRRHAEPARVPRTASAASAAASDETRRPLDSDPGTDYSKTIQILHMSDLPFGERPLHWINQLRWQAQSRRDQQQGFDYVVVSGGSRDSAEPGSSGRGLSCDDRAEIAKELSGLLCTRKDYNDRIVLLPGAGGDGDSTWSADIRLLEDLTFVVPSRRAQDDASLASLLQELQCASEAVEALEYNASTPTLLVTARPLILDGKGKPEIVQQIRRVLDRLRVTFNLYGRGPFTCLGPDPFGCPHFALGTGFSAREAQLRANAISIRMTFALSELGSYRNVHSVAIQALQWLAIKQFRTPTPFLSGELDAFFQKDPEAEAPTTPSFRDQLDHIRLRIQSLRIQKRQKAFCVRGLPGVGKHTFWEELKNPGIDGCHLVPLELRGSVKDLMQELRQAEIEVNAALETPNPSNILIAVFDLAVRPDGSTTDPWTRARSDLFAWFKKFIWQDRIVVLYLMRRIEDGDLDFYDREIHWENVELGPAHDRITERLRRRYSRVTPLDVDYLGRQTGNFVGIYSEVVRESAKVFQEQLNENGHGRVSLKSARAIIDRAVTSQTIEDLGWEFLSGLGEMTRALAVVLEWLQVLATSAGRELMGGPGRMHRFRLDDIYDLAEALDRVRLERPKIAKQVKSIISRLVRSGLLEHDEVQGDYFFAKTPPLIPFRIGSRSWSKTWKQRSAVFVFPPACSELAADLEILTAKRALSAGARIVFHFDQRSWQNLDWEYAALQADGLVIVNDNVPEERIVATLRDWEGRSRGPRPALVAITVGAEDSWRIDTPFRLTMPAWDDLVAQRRAADLIVSALGLGQRLEEALP